MMGRRGPGAREGGGLQAACLTWPEVLLTYGRDSSMGSRLTEHQVSGPTPFLLQRLLPVRGWDLGHPLVLCGRMGGAGIT